MALVLQLFYHLLVVFWVYHYPRFHNAQRQREMNDNNTAR